MKTIIGLSGGLDSTCLLHMLHCNPDINNDALLAVHINHNVSPNASTWQLHCQQLCEGYGIPFQGLSLNISDTGKKGFEAAARKARYAAFAGLMEHEDVLFTAHHQDDQAETFLLQALRGAGVKGLAAMPLVKSFAAGEHHRPLLHKTRAELLAYAEQHNLQWVEDESNQQIDYARNYLRHKVVPALQQRWPNALQSLAQSSLYAAEAMELATELAKQDIDTCITQRQTIDIKNLLLLSKTRKKNTLRYWLQQYASVPSGQILERIFTEVIPAADDATPLLTWAQSNLRRYQGELYCDAKPSSVVDESIDWNWQESIDIEGQRYCIQAAPAGIPKYCLPKTINIQFRQPGEKLTLFGNSQTKSLKKLLQAWQVPPWKRNCLPLFFADQQLIAAPPYYHATVNSDLAEASQVIIVHAPNGAA